MSMKFIALRAPLAKGIRSVVKRALSSEPPKFLMATTESVPGFKVVETFGLVAGSTVRTRNAGQDIFSGVKSVFGGELDSYTSLLAESRQEAAERMQKSAEEFGANAVIAVRIGSANVADHASEILMYGTAVKLEQE